MRRIFSVMLDAPCKYLTVEQQQGEKLKGGHGCKVYELKKNERILTYEQILEAMRKDDPKKELGFMDIP